MVERLYGNVEIRHIYNEYPKISALLCFLMPWTWPWTGVGRRILFFYEACDLVGDLHLDVLRHCGVDNVFFLSQIDY